MKVSQSGTLAPSPPTSSIRLLHHWQNFKEIIRETKKTESRCSQKDVIKIPKKESDAIDPTPFPFETVLHCIKAPLGGLKKILGFPFK